MDKNEEIIKLLKEYNQEHIIELLNKLNEEQKEELIEQLKNIDFHQIAELYENAKKEIELKENKSTTRSNDNYGITWLRQNLTWLQN